MSNVGRPTCQLWFEKNEPEKALPLPTTFVMNMMLGDIVEAVFKGLLKEAGVQYEDDAKVTLNLDDDTSISGTYDIVIDGAVDDIKSASNWSYTNKFESFDTLRQGDAFGYVAQLAGYAKAADKRAGGWWVVNKANGEFKYVPATGIDIDKEVDHIQQTANTLEENNLSVASMLYRRSSGARRQATWCLTRTVCSAAIVLLAGPASDERLASQRSSRRRLRMYH